jgi:hypothetical protein
MAEVRIATREPAVEKVSSDSLAFASARFSRSEFAISLDV